MKLILLKFVFILASSNYVLAQDTITKYYNKNQVEVEDKNQAMFYAKIFPDSNKFWTAHCYYMSNKIKMTGTYKTKKLNIKNGHFIYFYENGRKESEGNIVNGIYEGLWTFWNENGHKKSQGNFKKDVRQDKWTFWHLNGQKKSEGMYLDNKAQGKWEYWYDTGEKQSEGMFSNDRKDNIWKYFYKTGELKTEEKYYDGLLNSTSGYFENGKLKFTGKCVNGLSDGEWSYWGVDGRLILKGKFSNNLRDGEWTRFFPNGENMKIIYEKGSLVNTSLGGIY